MQGDSSSSCSSGEDEHHLMSDFEVVNSPLHR